MLSSHVVRDGASQEKGLPFCFWCKLQPSGKGRRQHQGWLLTSQRDDHSGMSPCNWNTGHYSITIYPLWNLPKMTCCMTLLTVLDYDYSIIMAWFHIGLCLHQLKLYSVYFMLRQSTYIIYVKIITSHCVPRECSDFLDGVYYIIFHKLFRCIFKFIL